jgi:hypothetical protein
MLKKGFLLSVALLVFTLNALAWGSGGHKMVASFAKAALSKQVADSVQKILGKMSFEDASVWMDEVRSDHTYDYMKPWHYINIEKDATYVAGDEKHIVSQLELALAMLKHKDRNQDKTSTALLLLFHLIGDLHQPLHCGYGDDKGGNEVQVNFEGKGTNLHSIWDTDLIEFSKINLISCLKFSNTLTTEEKRQIQKVDITAWMHESRAYLPTVYDFKKRTISDEYINSAKPIIIKQLTRAGIRLATILTLHFSKK